MKNTAYKRGFTLYELVITIGVLVIITGLVFAFIGTMSTYSKKTKNVATLLETDYGFRAETDYWFSIFDSQEYTLTPEWSFGGRSIVAFKNGTSEIYSISFTRATEENAPLRATFTYPQSSFHEKEVVVELHQVNAVYFFGTEDTYQYPENVLLDFSITQRIRGVIYRCLLVA